MRMGLAFFLSLVDAHGLRFSPAGEVLSFAWPKESTQRKSHPWCVGLRLPCDARHPRRGWNSPWRAHKTRLMLRSSDTRPLFPSAHCASRRHSRGHPCSRQRLANSSAITRERLAGVVPFCAAEACAGGEKAEPCLSSAARGVLCGLPGRVPGAPASGGEHRREAEGRTPGVAFLWLLSLAKQRK